MNDEKIKIGITIGDINGIGAEILIRTFSDARMLHFCTPIIYGSGRVLGYYRKVLGVQDFNINRINDATQAHTKKINLVSCWEEEIEIEMGKSTSNGGKYAQIALQYAVDDLKLGKIDALVTMPINKHNIQSQTFNYAGHTEYLQAQFETKDSLMFLISEQMRVGVVCGHVPMAAVAQQITVPKILSKLRLMQECLQNDFSINRPKIAVLGLNPHAGDSGTIGSEEQTIIKPCIEKAKQEGILAFGPYPADGFFSAHSYQKFDAVLAMYHDQGLIPFKTLCFETGVNYTAGLPIVRTSPDHGTAYELVGKSQASLEPFRQALYQAIFLYKNRKLNESLKANALVKTVLASEGDNVNI